MKLAGRAWVLPDNVDTDQIIPGRFLSLHNKAELGRHCLENMRPEFAKGVQPGDIVVAGALLGCGSSREQAVLALQGAGIAAVVAVSFARIFLRNAINLGLPALDCAELRAETEDGDPIELDVGTGTIHNGRTGKTYQATPLPPFVLDIITAGGLIPFTRRELEAEATGVSSG